MPTPALARHPKVVATPHVGGLILVGGMIAVFFYGYHIINPIIRAIADATGLDLYPARRAMDRFHFW